MRGSNLFSLALRHTQSLKSLSYSISKLFIRLSAANSLLVIRHRLVAKSWCFF